MKESVNRKSINSEPINVESMNIESINIDGTMADLRRQFLIAGTSSGVGKTTITLGIMAALKNRGYSVQPYKVGPDYIDTAYHSKVTGRKSRNLDSYMLEDEKVKYLFNRARENAEIAVVEGVMGLYDGKGASIHHCSSAAMAKLLNLPVILVINAKAMAASSAAMVLGYQLIDSEVKIAGIIANQVKTESHFKLVKEAIENYCNIPVLGYFPPNENFSLPSRHLGLVPSSELEALEDVFSKLGEAVEKFIDIDKLLELCQGEKVASDFKPVMRLDRRLKRVAVAYDEAFNFYYEDNLELLRDLGVELIYFSPLRDESLPECDFIYIGGGFPEVFAEQLESNNKLRKALKKAHENGIPIYAECGGLMYLGERLVDLEERSFEMVGVFKGESRMTSGLKRFGYCYGEAMEDTILSKAGTVLRGHEFHHSEFFSPEKAVYRMKKNKTDDEDKAWLGGYSKGNTLASYLHIHFFSHLEAVERFLSHREEA